MTQSGDKSDRWCVVCRHNKESADVPSICEYCRSTDYSMEDVDDDAFMLTEDIIFDLRDADDDGPTSVIDGSKNKGKTSIAEPVIPSYLVGGGDEQ